MKVVISTLSLVGALTWWWMGSQMGMAFEKSPLLAGLPHEDFLSPLHFRIVKEGSPLPVAGFRKEDLVVYGEGGSARRCFGNLAQASLRRRSNNLNTLD